MNNLHDEISVFYVLINLWGLCESVVVKIWTIVEHTLPNFGTKISFKIETELFCLAATNIATHTLELGEVRFDWLLEKPQKQLRGQAPTPGTTENFDSCSGRSLLQHSCSVVIFDNHTVFKVICHRINTTDCWLLVNIAKMCITNCTKQAEVYKNRKMHSKLNLNIGGTKNKKFQEKLQRQRKNKG